MLRSVSADAVPSLPDAVPDKGRGCAHDDAAPGSLAGWWRAIGKRAVRRGMNCRRGVASIEFALVGGTFLIMLLAAVDIGRYYMTVQGVRTFAADAERYGTVNMWWSGTGTHVATCAEVLTATGRGGAVAGLVGGSAGNCVTRVQSVVSGTNVVTVSVGIDVTFNFVINVFGIASPRIRETSSVTFQL